MRRVSMIACLVVMVAAGASSAVEAANGPERSVTVVAGSQP